MGCLAGAAALDLERATLPPPFLPLCILEQLTTRGSSEQATQRAPSFDSQKIAVIKPTKAE